ncbi:MAG: ABC transporter permease [Planctomycetes bacterium]|nr:ABC transporter permease [Planctomycetota bacterium]
MNLLHDIRFAVRMLHKEPGFTLVAVLMLALGIGGTTAMFTVVKAVLLQPLPMLEPDRLVMLWEHQVERDAQRNVVNPGNFMGWRDQNQTFIEMAAMFNRGVNLTGEGQAQRVTITYATSNFFSTLGVSPKLGRAFVEEDADPEGRAMIAVMLSDRLFQSRYGGRQDIIGSDIMIDGKAIHVVGVMPAEFQFPQDAELWTPVLMLEQFRQSRGRFMQAIGRLKPDVSVEAAQADLDAVSLRLQEELPDFNAGWKAQVIPLHDDLVLNVRQPLLLLLGAVGFVLLIACANVANLLLTRGVHRRRELAIRSALGAGSWRLARQAIVESLLIALMGGGLGLLIASWGVGALHIVAADTLPNGEAVQLDSTIVFFAIGLSVVTGLVFGLLPAIKTNRIDVSNSLKDGSHQTSEGPRGGWTRKTLVVGQIALSISLLVGAGLLLNSFVKLSTAPTGFEAEGLLTFSVTLPASTYPDNSSESSFLDSAIERISALPAIRSASAVTYLPIGEMGAAQRFTLPDREAPPANQPLVADVRAVTPGFFETMGTTLLRGRAFSEFDVAGAEYVVIINESMARRFWPESDAIGEFVDMEWNGMRHARIVGIVNDVRLRNMQTVSQNTLYWTHEQHPSWRSIRIIARCSGDPAEQIAAVRKTMAGLDSELPLANVETLDAIVSDSLLQQRILAYISGGFSVFALLLSMIGLFGVMSYSVKQRVREIGIRMALGAQRSDVMAHFMKQGAILTLIGVAIGLLAAYGLTGLLSSQLYQVTPSDPMTFIVVPTVLTIVAMVACYLPARQATRIDPMKSLRAE